MNRRKFKVLASLSFALILLLSWIPQGRAQDAKTQSEHGSTRSISYCRCC
jgi:hypothetical protein